MRPRDLLVLAGLTLLCCSVWIIAQRPVAWAQAAPEAAVFVDRAVIAYDERRFDDALRELEEALRLDPESVEAL